eukprot:scaffold8_cov142-Skeletonema_marinoi.AAC.1
MLTGRTATPYSHNSNSKSKSTSSNLDSKNTQTNIMHLYKSAIVLLAAAPAITAEVNFEQYDADISTNNPQISQDSWTVTIDGKVTGLGSDGPNTKFYGYTAGFIDTVCINGGSETPPGQNRDSITLSGSVVGTTDSDSNGAYAYDLVMSENCSCGKEGATFEAVVGKGKDKALTEFQCDNGPFVDDLDGDGGVCCGAVREGDEVDCGGCNCRVGDYLKDCPNSRKNLNYAQYAIGIQVKRTIVDAVVRDESPTGPIVTIKRQVCFASEDYNKVDGTHEICLKRGKAHEL